jgi:hypothetical protein
MESMSGNVSMPHADGREGIAIEVLSPRGDIMASPNVGLSPRVADLAGKRLGIYWVGKEGGNNFWDVVERSLRERFPTATITRFKGPFDLGDTAASRLASECDAILYGVGD